MSYKITKPWGSEEILYEDPKLIVKKIFIKKGEQLSLQYHKYKDEVWFYGDFQIINIPRGTLHTNELSDKDSYILEVSTNIPNDVVRVADRYGRNKKMLIFDMDNTLCDSCQPISDEMKNLLEKLSNHYIITVIGGSTYEEICKQVIERLTCNSAYVLSNSGTMCAHICNGVANRLFENSLSKGEKQKIISVLDQLIKKYDIKTLTTRDDQLRDRGSQITLSAIGRNAPSELKKEFDPLATKRKEWVGYLKELLPEYEITIGGTTSIDITKKGNNKGDGIRKFVNIIGNQRNLRLDDVLFVGDGLFEGGNDFSVMSVVDCIPVKNPNDTSLLVKKVVQHLKQ